MAYEMPLSGGIHRISSINFDFGLLRDGGEGYVRGKGGEQMRNLVARILHANHVQYCKSSGKQAENPYFVGAGRKLKKRLVSLGCGTYTGQRRRGRVVEGAPLLRE